MLNWITTVGVDIYNSAGDTRVKLTCITDDTLDIHNLVTYTVQLTNETTTTESVLLNCEVDNTLSVGNIKISDTGITFADNSVQITAYTGGGDGNVFETVTIGASGTQAILSCTDDDVLSVTNIIITDAGITFPDGKTQTIAYEGGGAAITLAAGAGISIVEDPQLTYTITNTGGGGGGAVNGIVAGTGITVDDDGQGVFTINNTVNAADFLTTTDAASTYETIANANNTFETKTAAANTFQTIANMSNYSTTTQANLLYLPLTQVAHYQLQFNTSVLTANTTVTKLFTIPNFKSSSTASIVMTANALDGIAYAYSCEWTGDNNDGSAGYTATIGNFSDINWANNIRNFSVIVINVNA